MMFEQASTSPAVMHRPPERAEEQADSAFSTRDASLLAAGTVHDLGNLIQLATSAIGLLSRSSDLRSGRSASLVASARASLERAGALVGKALGRSPSPVTASLVECVAEVEAAMRGAAQAGLVLDVRLDPQLPALSCDPLGLQCALLNLAFNARDAMTGRGIVTIRGGRGAGRASALLDIQVIDTGIGMTPETVARALDPFFTTKSDGLGGIGLPMVERFVRESGGEIAIESEPGLGTTVTLRLPVAGNLDANLKEEG